MSKQTRLFVSNLPDDFEENNIRSAFGGYGDIVNIDIKTKSSETAHNNRFAFITISASNNDIESCIKHFSTENVNGHKLHVTRARESFLERLQREREELQKKETLKHKNEGHLSKTAPVINLGPKLNPRKKKLENNDDIFCKKNKTINNFSSPDGNNADALNLSQTKEKKENSDKKRLEAMKKKREEFKAKKNIVSQALTSIDKTTNKKTKFPDFEESVSQNQNLTNGYKNDQRNKNTLFDDEESDNEINFTIKKQFEGAEGQKILDLQSRYKSDKRFILDERFMEENNEKEDIVQEESEEVELGQIDEKSKQLNILQDVLGVTINSKQPISTKKKPKLGMIRFDPTNPDHAKFIAPVEEKKTTLKKTKREKDIKNEDKDAPIEVPAKVDKIEVSKEQFYKISDTLKETIAQPSTFSLRSLFASNQDNLDQESHKSENYVYEEVAKNTKVKNPLDPSSKNPFVYDSSDSECEETSKQPANELKPLEQSNVSVGWKENLFFHKSDSRFKDAIAFFTKSNECETQKERRSLKSIMKKRAHNNDRKNQMFKRKIGGRRKTLKKSMMKKNKV